MLKPLTKFLVCTFLSALLAACGQAGEPGSGSDVGGAAAESTLPEAVPADFPFPEGADIDVKTMATTGAKQYIASFSFTGDAGSVYKGMKAYAETHGYSLAIENESAGRFSATGNGGEGIVVNISDMGSVKVGTVTFTVVEN